VVFDVLLNRRPRALLIGALVASAVLASCGALTGPGPSAPASVAPSGGEPATLRVDGLAKIVDGDGIPSWKRPAATARNRIAPDLPFGTVLFLVGGPRSAGGATWWLVQPEDADPTLPFVWVRQGAAASPGFAPLRLACPAADGIVDAQAIQPLSPLRRLACFGGRELHLEGAVTCTPASAESMVAGPTWLDSSRVCILDGALGVTGKAVWPASSAGDPTTVTGAVTGHFDDPESKTCGLIPFGVTVSGPVGPPDPPAVLICRELFVVSSVVPR
jgi:hypothetical protein